MSEMIDAAVQKFTEYCGYTLEESVVIQLHGAKEYPLPDKITNIISLKTGLSGNLTDFASNFGDYIPNLWSDMYFSNSLTGDIIPNIMMISATTSVLDKYFGTDIYYNFNQHRKILQVFDPYEGPAVLHYQYEYIANEEDDLIYNHEWIKAYTIAKTKEIWGSILGKYSQSLVGGAQINYGDITGKPFYKEYMGLKTDPETAYHALNSKGKNVIIQEDGWAAPGTEPTHMMIHILSSCGKAFYGGVGNTVWVDNVEIVM
mgnify:CR=1 FL=1